MHAEAPGSIDGSLCTPKSGMSTSGLIPCSSFIFFEFGAATSGDLLSVTSGLLCGSLEFLPTLVSLRGLTSLVLPLTGFSRASVCLPTGGSGVPVSLEDMSRATWTERLSPIREETLAAQTPR